MLGLDTWHCRNSRPITIIAEVLLIERCFFFPDCLNVYFALYCVVFHDALYMRVL